MFANNVFHVQSALIGVNGAIQSLQTTCRDLQARLDSIHGSSSSVSAVETRIDDVEKRLESIDRLESLINVQREKIDTYESRLKSYQSVSTKEVNTLVQSELKRTKDLIEMSLGHKFDTYIPKLVEESFLSIQRSMEENINTIVKEIAKFDSRLTEIEVVVTHLSSCGPRRVNILENLVDLDRPSAKDLDRPSARDLDRPFEILGNGVTFSDLQHAIDSKSS